MTIHQDIARLPVTDRGDFHFAMNALVLDLETGRVGRVKGRMEREGEVDFYLVQPLDGTESEWLSDLILTD